MSKVGGPCVPCEKGSIDNVSLKADPVVVKALDWLNINNYKCLRHTSRVVKRRPPSDGLAERSTRMPRKRLLCVELLSECS